MFKDPHYLGVMALLLMAASALEAGEDDQARLMAALLAENQMIENLASLTDEVGGRVTGSPANLKAVAWALARFRERGVDAVKEPFEMPQLWLERNVVARLEGDASFTVNMVAMPFSAATDEQGVRAPLLDAGYGTAQDFAVLGERAQGSLLLVHTHALQNLDDLFREYELNPKIEARANAAGAMGLVYMASRTKNLLYRHNASLGPRNTLPMLIMEREAAGRVARLLAKGNQLDLWVLIGLEIGASFTSYNVIGEIKGSAKPEEFVVVGAHLDSWDLGTGALDNGCNVAMMIEIAAQIKRLAIKPRRTIRFCLWNGEEQGMLGSYGYTKSHASELDQHAMALSIDIGSGRLTGFFVDGPDPFTKAISKALEPVSGLGPFQHVIAPVVGTDNYDFMMQGVANLVGNHDPANYGPNYHARSDTFDKVDQSQLRLNSVVVAALTLSFAQMERSWGRRTRAQIEELIQVNSLKNQMDAWGGWESWLDGSRGRSK